MKKLILLRLGGGAFIILSVFAIFQVWLADRRDRDRLNAELAATKQLLSAASVRQHDRDAQLNQTLATLAAEKRTVQTPSQILRDLPRQLPLPTPIVLESPAMTKAAPRFSIGASSRRNSSMATQDTEPRSRVPVGSRSSQPSAPPAVIPAEDLKPLYDFALDCKACQARLAAAQSDLADEKSKTAALTKERDQALQVARGGSVFRRMRRAAKWFLIGAAAGAVAAKSAH